jgi:hypothetical protein
MNRIIFLSLLICSSPVFSQKQTADSSVFVLKINNKWVAESPTVQPRPVEGINYFYNTLAFKILSSKRVMQYSTTSCAFVSFEIDTLGNVLNVTYEWPECMPCGEQLVRLVYESMGNWTPAQLNEIKYPSRFFLPIKFAVGNSENNENKEVQFEHLPKAKQLKTMFFNHNAPANQNSRKVYSLDGVSEFNDLQTALTHASSVRILHLNSREVKALPKSLVNLNRLRLLNARDNELTTLPENIGELSKLEELLLDNNKLTSLPIQLENLKLLKILSLTKNDFKEFPMEVLDIKNLRLIDLSDNPIASIPPEIRSLKKLKVLALINTNITSLPDEFFKLKRLEKLFIDPSRLKEEDLLKLKRKLPRLEIINE